MKRLLLLGLVACSGKPPIDHDNDTSKHHNRAHDELERIAKSAKQIFADTKAFPLGAGASLPHGNAEPGSYSGHCCGAKDASGTVVNKCQPDTAWKGDPQWAKLGFSIDGPSEYQYSYLGASNSFTAYAVGDLDCDTEMATFTLNGIVNAQGEPEVTLTPPPKNTY
jgi:hypothetical protein